MFKIFVLLMVFYNVFYVNAGSERLTEQERRFVKMIRDACVTESGVEESSIEKMYDGVFENVKPLKLYIKCTWKLVDALDDDGHLDEQVFIGLTPPERLDWARRYTDKCEHIASTNEDELLDSIYNYMVCLYNMSPAEFCCP